MTTNLDRSKHKYTGESKNFGIRWVKALASDETISTSTWAVESGSGLTIVTDSETTTVTTVKLSGGNAGTWDVTNTITTSSPYSQTLIERLQIEVEA